MKVINKDIEEMILKISGEIGLQIFKALKNQENINEFIIAEKLNLPINQLRNALYKFETHNLLSTTRKKDRKKGWYIYFLTFRPDEAEKVVIKLRKDELERLNKTLTQEESHEYYSCPKRCTRSTLENAMENQFKCYECGELLTLEDNVKKVNQIKREMKLLEKQLI